MKSILFITTLLVVSLSSFTTTKSSDSFKYYQTTDSIPAMNKQIIEFVKTKIKKKVRTGEC